PGGVEIEPAYLSDGKIDEVTCSTTAGTWKLKYNWSVSGQVTIVHSIGTRNVQKIEYHLSGGQLRAIERSVKPEGSGPDVWDLVAGCAFSYHAGSGLLRHVIPPAVYRQMVNNGANPVPANPDDLNPWAETEFEWTGGKVTKLYT